MLFLLQQLMTKVRGAHGAALGLWVWELLLPGHGSSVTGTPNLPACAFCGMFKRGMSVCFLPLVRKLPTSACESKENASHVRQELQSQALPMQVNFNREATQHCRNAMGDTTQHTFISSARTADPPTCKGHHQMSQNLTWAAMQVPRATPRTPRPSAAAAGAL